MVWHCNTYIVWAVGTFIVYRGIYTILNFIFATKYISFHAMHYTHAIPNMPISIYSFIYTIIIRNDKQQRNAYAALKQTLLLLTTSLFLL